VSPERFRVAWLPPLLVGAAAAASAEMALGLLLYVSAGFVPALTLILCVQTGALAFGLWMAPRDAAPPWIGVRRAWFLLVLSYVGGAVLAASWEALGGLSSTWATRGLGLGMLTALPLYGSGLLLGAPALSEGVGKATAALAALGAAIGFAVIGVLGAGLELAATAYVTGMCAISVAALIHGGVLGASEQRWREWAERGATGESAAFSHEVIVERRRAATAAPPPSHAPSSSTPRAPVEGGSGTPR
jgi:hypothetical protein